MINWEIKREEDCHAPDGPWFTVVHTAWDGHYQLCIYELMPEEGGFEWTVWNSATEIGNRRGKAPTLEEAKEAVETALRSLKEKEGWITRTVADLLGNQEKL
jgi:hypothetical protein